MQTSFELARRPTAGQQRLWHLQPAVLQPAVLVVRARSQRLGLPEAGPLTRSGLQRASALFTLRFPGPSLLFYDPTVFPAALGAQHGPPSFQFRL